MIFNYDANKTHFHNKGFALNLVSKVSFLELGNGLLSGLSRNGKRLLLEELGLLFSSEALIVSLTENHYFSNVVVVFTRCLC